jgi:hypothetical protein
MLPAEVRNANPNPDVDEYRSELDLHKRKFAVEQARLAQGAGTVDVEIIALARSIYNFLNE